mgnify:CR=1 FL=1
MTIYVISVLFFGFGFIFLGLLIYFKRRDSLGKYWLLYSLACGFWGIGYSYQINNYEDYRTALMVSRIADSAATLIPVFWLRFLWEYLQLKPRPKLFAVLYSICGVVLLTAPTPFFIDKLIDKSHIGFAHFVHGGPTFDLMTAYFVLVIALGFYLIFKNLFRKNLSESFKKQTQYLAFTSVIGFFAGGTAFLPCYDIDFPIKYTTLFLPFYPILMFFAVSRYRFLDADEMAQAAHRDKLASIGILATSINHEVKNPLFIISGLAEGYLSKVKEGLLSDPKERLARAEEIFAKTVEQSSRASEIIKRFAMFAKEGVKDEMKPEMLSLGQVLDDVLPLVRHELELTKIELVHDIPADLPPVTVDRHHLTQILFNLIINACQAMSSPPSFPPPVKRGEAGGGRLTIRAESTAEGVQISISDTGPGMSEEQLREIFQPFRTTKAEGTGLGLYITKLLVEKNGGRISVESKPGRGTKFVVEFRDSGKL